MENSRQNIELADIFSSHEKDFLQNHTLCPEQLKVFNAIMQCRTAALGGHMERCDTCGYTRQSYNSCRNRQRLRRVALALADCPKCQFIKTA